MRRVRIYRIQVFVAGKGEAPLVTYGPLKGRMALRRQERLENKGFICVLVPFYPPANAKGLMIRLHK